MKGLLNPRNLVVAALIAFLLLLPVYTSGTGNYFLLSLFTRVVILAMAATSLNLILGYGGMVSFGHAVYLGVGGYAIGILAYEGVYSGWLQWPLAIAASALGRTDYRPAQPAHARRLFHHDYARLRANGLLCGCRSQPLWRRRRAHDLSPKPVRAWLDFSNKTLFYYVCVAFLLGTIYLVYRLMNSRFGLVIQGSRSNDRRMRSIGFPTFRYRLVCFVIAGTICGISGALLANHTDFVSPAMMHWTRSGDLIVMVVLGGWVLSSGR
jgi:branched-chain amino acid transport system permease protein